MSTSFLAEAFSVTSKTISQWEKEGCPKAGYGYWYLADVIIWRDKKISEKSILDVDQMSPAQKELYWDTKRKEYQAEFQQLKNSIMKGEYIPKAQIQKELASFFVILKQAMLSIPRKVAITSAQYVGNTKAREVENEVQGVILHALNQWSGGKFTDCAGVDEATAEHPKAARKNNGKRVGGQKQGTRRKKLQ